MCGLIGFCGSKNADPNLLKILMLYNLERGEDAAGMYFNGMNYRETGKVTTGLLNSYDIEECKIFIGHDRKASWGTAKNIDNVHPFVFNHIIGGHNGTLTNVNALEKKYKYTGLIDSKIIFKKLSEEGSYDKMDISILEDLDGAAAIVFYNSKTKCLYAYRNKERPLFRGKRPEGIYISSIKESLKCIQCENIKEFTEDYIYKIRDGEIEKTKKIKNVPIRIIFNQQSSNTPATNMTPNRSNVNNDSYVNTVYVSDKEPLFEFDNFYYESYNNFMRIAENPNGSMQKVYDYWKFKNNSSDDEAEREKRIQSRLIESVGYCKAKSYDDLRDLCKTHWGIPTQEDLHANPSKLKEVEVYYDQSIDCTLIYNKKFDDTDNVKYLRELRTVGAVAYWDVNEQIGKVKFPASAGEYKDADADYSQASPEQEEYLRIESEIIHKDTLVSKIGQGVNSIKSSVSQFAYEVGYGVQGFDYYNNGKYDEIDDKIEETSDMIQYALIYLETFGEDCFPDKNELSLYVKTLGDFAADVDNLKHELLSAIEYGGE